MNKNYTQVLPDESATCSVGQKLAQLLTAPMRVYLSGPLGAGKTALVRSFLQTLGVKGLIKSPTYALVEPYSFSSYSIYHFDFYRFFDQNEWEASGFRDCFEEHAICLVEWAEKAGDLLPLPDLHIHLKYSGEGREIHIQAHTPKGCALIGQFK